jgi:hypothetical protein
VPADGLVPYDAVAANEETFGPLVIVEAVDSDEEAVVAANRVMYGLTSSILTSDTYRGFEMAPKVLSGIVNVNSPTVNDEIHAPMGGVRDSGWGRTGPDSLADFSDVIFSSPRHARLLLNSRDGRLARATGQSMPWSVWIRIHCPGAMAPSAWTRSPGTSPEKYGRPSGQRCSCMSWTHTSGGVSGARERTAHGTSPRVGGIVGAPMS